MSTLSTRREVAAPPDDTNCQVDGVRISTRFGLVFPVCQIAVMITMAIFVLPHGGSPSGPALDRGRNVLDAESLYRFGNYVFMCAGLVLMGFLGAVNARLRQVDRSGALATVAVAAGTVLSVLWPFAGVLHDLALDTAVDGADLRILGAWDAAAPYALAFSALPRLFFVGSIVIGLRAAGSGAWLQRTGVVIMVLSAVGTATSVTAAVFPVLALSTLAYEVWIGALAWHWLRDRQPAVA